MNNHLKNRSYTLGGLFNENDKSNVEYTLNEMKSVDDVTVNLEQKQASFSFDPDEIAEEFIENTINSLGYSVRKKV